MKSLVSDFNEKNCKLFFPFEIFKAIHAGSAGDPCHNGCIFFDCKECFGFESFKPRASALKSVSKSNQDQPIIHNHHHVSFKSNAEIAKEIGGGCSKRKVANMRKNGTLPEGYK